MDVASIVRSQTIPVCTLLTLPPLPQTDALPCLVDPPQLADTRARRSLRASEVAGPVCLGPTGPMAKAWPAGCGHKFCEKCATRWLEQSTACPMCRAKVASDNTRVKRAIHQVNLEIMHGLAPLVLHVS